MPPHIIFFTEFRGPNVATGVLAEELLEHLQARLGATYSFFHSHQPYRPGGKRPIRLVTFVLLHLLLPFYMIFHRLVSLVRGTNPLLIVTTTPPLSHWTSVICGRLTGIPVLIWYQDAHPEIECRMLEQRGLNAPASLLRWIDAVLTPKADAIITLDDAMRDLLAKQKARLPETLVVPPWSTYLTPAAPLRLPTDRQNLKLLYAGNYGVAHDLNPMADLLRGLPEGIQKQTSLCFVGMNESAQGSIKRIFSGTKAKMEFLPRFAERSKLLDLMRRFDFGIVSQRYSDAGIVAPSKSYSYISQGLPLLYVGPTGTMPAKMVEAGWGLELSTEFFKNWVEMAQVRCGLNNGKIYPDPREAALGAFEASVRRIAGRPEFLSEAKDLDRT